jgi:hypothetical protein
MRQYFRHQGRAIPLLHRNGKTYKISPQTEHMRRLPIENLPKFGGFKIASEMRFSDE